MSNSLNFLNKPATPAKTIGPQPKPGSAGSPTAAAPKSAFLDKSNPWAVGGGTPTASAKTKPPRTQTPAPSTRSGTAATPRANIPSTGYNYTNASYTGATPQQRAREVDQAQMAAQATRQRRERERQAAQQAAAAAQAAKAPKVDARPFPTYTDPASPFAPQAANTAPAIPAATPGQSLLTRAANAWLRFATGEPLPAQPAAPTQPQNPTPAMSPAIVNQYFPTPPVSAEPGRPAATTPPAPAAAGTNVPTAAGQPLFYGYSAPGPLTVERTAPLQGGQMRPWMTDRPLYTGYGQRAMLSDAQLAAEYTQRQRDAAGSQANLTANYRPWAALTDAEKYQRRFGVMPQGAQMTPDNSTGVAAQAASTAQRERLIKEYWQRYAPVLGWVDPPLWQYEGAPRTGRETIQRGPSGAGAKAAAPAKAATQATVLQEAQQLAKLYLGGLDTTDFELQDIVAILSRFNPPPDLQQQFSDDMTRLAARIPNE